ncbi:MAG: phosphatidylglycerophosphatase A [Balneolaceae bacterium]|nr:phosphatidylglycerophosphatase A [Balneolaceae bacterium]MDR9446318.1 phosphatidylglycerophosphatase A [Balneolaceae bacterium]
MNRKESLATMMGIGHLPYAQGTVASFTILLESYIVYALLSWISLPTPGLWMGILYGLSCCVWSWITLWAAEEMIQTHGPDPSALVSDEAAGMSFVISVMFLLGEFYGDALQMKGWITITLAVCFFRVYDITKPLGIRRLERVSAGNGILLDDLAAAFAAVATTVGLMIVLMMI